MVSAFHMGPIFLTTQMVLLAVVALALVLVDLSLVLAAHPQVQYTR
jgi:hypothetical protein